MSTDREIWLRDLEQEYATKCALQRQLGHDLSALEHAADSLAALVGRQMRKDRPVTVTGYTISVRNEDGSSMDWPFKSAPAAEDTTDDVALFPEDTDDGDVDADNDRVIILDDSDDDQVLMNLTMTILRLVRGLSEEDRLTTPKIVEAVIPPWERQTKERHEKALGLVREALRRARILDSRLWAPTRKTWAYRATEAPALLDAAPSVSRQTGGGVVDLTTSKAPAITGAP